MNNTTNSSIGCAYVPRNHKQWWDNTSHFLVMAVLKIHAIAGIRFVVNKKNAGWR